MRFPCRHIGNHLRQNGSCRKAGNDAIVAVRQLARHTSWSDDEFLDKIASTPPPKHKLLIKTPDAKMIGKATSVLSMGEMDSILTSSAKGMEISMGEIDDMLKEPTAPGPTMSEYKSAFGKLAKRPAGKRLVMKRPLAKPLSKDCISFFFPQK